MIANMLPPEAMVPQHDPDDPDHMSYEVKLIYDKNNLNSLIKIYKVIATSSRINGLC